MPTVTEGEVIGVYRAEVRRLFASVCRQTRGDRALAEDLVQETWLRAVDAWRARGLPDNPEAWLHRVARNLLVSHYRRIRREVPQAESIASATAGRAEEEWALADRIEGLDAENAALIRGFHFEGRTTAELALQSGLSKRAVEGRLRRARIALAEALRTAPPRKEKSDG